MSVVADTRLAAPFLGLRYFDEEHSHLFFGCDVQINDVLEKLRRSRLVTVMGSSGSGKSSLVRSGVIPRLKAGLLGEAGPRWRIAKMRPGSNPIASLARELEKALSAQGLEVTLRRGPLGLVQAVEECQLAPTENVLVIADQFEEVFRYQRESSQPDKAKDEAAAFVKLLLEATSQRTRAIYVIVTMRSDYLGNCAQFRDLPERINEGLYLVPRMRRDQLEEAIAGPVAVEDAEITPRLLQKLLNETGDDADQLPVLQHALLRAWNAWNSAPRPLDLQDFEAIGGTKDGLSRHADEIFTGLSTEEQRIARVIFQQLSQRDAEGREIRRPAPVAQVAAVADATEQGVDEVVERFAAPDAAFLYRNEDGDLDVTHESLIRKWSRIQGAKQGGTDGKGWMQEEADARDEFLLLIERAAKNDTLVGRALDDATAWRALGLNAAWAARYVKVGGRTFENVLWFVEACQTQDAAYRRHRRRWWQIGVASVVVVLVVIAMLWWSAERQRAAADEAARQAQFLLARSSTQEAVQLIAENRPHEAFAHLARALRFAPDDVPSQSLIADLVRLAREGTLWVSGPAFAHQGGVRSAAFSPDGRRIVTASGDRMVRVWDADTGQLVGAPLQPGVDLRSAVFSPDGRRIVTASTNRTVEVWDSSTGQPVGGPLQQDTTVTSAVFSPDGSQIVTVSFLGRAAQVWDAGTGQPVGGPLLHKRRVTSAVFSPDGRRILTASDDNTARVWDAGTGQPVGAPLQHQNSVSSAVFSTDGRRILTAADGTTRVWDAGTGQPVGTPLQHQDGVNSAVFSPDGRRIVTVSFDGTARLWTLGTGQPLGTPLQHQGSVNSAVFSPDGRRILTSDDRTARLWDAATGSPMGPPLQHQGRLASAVFSPDGRRILTASADGTARVWEAGRGPSVSAPLQHQATVTTAGFSPDGRRIVTASTDGTVRVWDAGTGQPMGAPLLHQLAVDSLSWFTADFIISAVFSPDGRRILTASDDNTARVWDAGTGQPVGAPLLHQGGVTSAGFSPDGRRIVTASWDGTARVWDADTGQPVGAPLQHQRAPESLSLSRSTVYSAVFSPDGRRIVTASDDNTARVWDAGTGQPVGAPLLHQGGVRSAVFSPDGRRIVTASTVGPRRNIRTDTSFDGTARVWDAGTGQPVGAPLLQQGGVRSAVFSPDGRLIVTASDDNTARVWDAGTGVPVGTPLQHQNSVSSAVFSPEGSRIVTASADGTARVWDAGTGQPVGTPLQHQDGVNSAVFSPDGRRIVTASNDRTARVWDVLLESGSVADTELLADLAEVLGGYRVNELGSVVSLEQPARLQRISRLAGPGANGFVPLDVLVKRFLPASR